MTCRKIIFPVLGAALLCAASCVYVDESLGSNFIPNNHIYDVATATITLDPESVWMESSDNLSAYSSNRITLGTIKTAGGTTFRASAFSVQPLYGYDEINIGEVQEIKQFHFSFVKDSVYCKDASQRHILQNVRVYELKDTLGSNIMYSSQFDAFDGGTGLVNRAGGTITIGTPVYSGGDSLSFDASTAYAQKFVTEFQANPKRFAEDKKAWLKDFPGIYMEVDEPAGEGGRINMFRAALSLDESYYITGGFAELKVRTAYDKDGDGVLDEPVDTAFYFYFGPADRTDTGGSQYAFNVYRQPSDELSESNPIGKYTMTVDAATSRKKAYYDGGKKLVVEGGTGLKPVVSAKRMHDLMLDYFATKGIEPSEVVINKATLVFPFEPKDNVAYEDMALYPPVLSPTCKISATASDGTKYPTFAGLTDSSVSSENQGDVNRSKMIYSPDISHHVQEIIKLKDDASFDEYDIWLLVMAYETITTTSKTSSGYDDYYNQLAYANYYNNLYGGYGGYGYGGYGYGYGGYGYNDYYSNYYNYYMLSSMYGSSSNKTTTTTQLMLDLDRYYEGMLGGAEDDDPLKPHLDIIYSTVHK